MANQSQIGKTCPYCQTQIQPGDGIKVCVECDQPHHADCWMENEGCTTYGCVCAPNMGASHRTIGSLSDVESVQASVTDRNYYDNHEITYAEPEGRIGGWNWGAFLLTPVWLIMMKLEIWAIILIAAVVIIPTSEFKTALVIISSLIFGATGNELAWKSREWRNMNHFRATQTSWNIWAIHTWIIGGYVAFRLYVTFVRNS